MPTPLDMTFDQLPPQAREGLMLTEELWEEIRRDYREREALTPDVGTLAPDFELKRLDAEGALTDQTVRLSSLRGRPVGLVLGSYT